MRHATTLSRLTPGVRGQLSAMRRALLAACFGGALTTAMPLVTTGYTGASYRDVRPDLIASVTRLLCPLPGTTSTLEVHGITSSVTWSGRIAIVFGGHGGSYYTESPYFTASLTAAALARGDYVLGVCVPLAGLNPSSMTITRPIGGDITVTTHDQLAGAVDLGGISALRFWIDQVVIALNYAIPLLNPRTVYALGFSDGGWAVEWLAAVEQRIKRTCSLAGSNPYGFLDSTGAAWEAVGGQSDGEQRRYYDLTTTIRPWWVVVGHHTALYELAAHPAPRRFLRLTTTSDQFFGQQYNVSAFALLAAKMSRESGGRALLYVDPYALPSGHTVTPNEVAVAMAATF